MPTETVYGLAADAADARAVAAVYEAKGRPSFNPLIAHVADVGMARRIARFDDRAEALAARFWPGPLTLVLPVADAHAVCDLAQSKLTPPSSLDCTAQTFVPNGSAAYFWADDRHLSASGQLVFGSAAVTRAQNNSF